MIKGPDNGGGLPRGLYLVATPIGNLGDLSPRARHTLNSCDRVICEDTRVARRLFSTCALSGSFTAYHDHNAARVRPAILQHLQNGAALALISDAGTPLISDPGLKLVRACQGANIPVFAVPGPNAALAALILSGLPCDRFFFAGFLPPRRAARRRDIASLKHIPGSLIFYERASRIPATLRDLATELGNRPGALVREITKKYETVHRDTLTNLATHYDQSPARGEIVLVVAPHSARESTSDAQGNSPEADAQIDRHLQDALRTHTGRDAVTLVARQTGKPRREVYARIKTLTTNRGR